MSNYKRLTNNNRNEYDPEYDFCCGCQYFGEPCGCNRPNGTCDNYDRFLETYSRLAKLEDKIENKMLMEMPCKIGDTIYYTNFFTSPPRIEEYVLTGIKIYANELLHKISTEIECYPVKDGPCSFGRYAFTDSNSIFTSRAKAKQELEKFQNE